MKIERSFRVATSRDDAVERLYDDATLIELLPGDTEIVASEGDVRTTRTRYSALGREGEATFRFTYLLDGNIRFEKVCDGKIWKRLDGSVEVEEDGDGARVPRSRWTGGRSRSFPSSPSRRRSRTRSRR